jgi:aspartate ammonia-lyase
MARFRTEHDTMGRVRVPFKALWGAQTARAVENFPVSGLRADTAMIRAYVLSKKAAAVANECQGALPENFARAIGAACDEILGPGEPGHDELVRVAVGRGSVRVRDPIHRPSRAEAGDLTGISERYRDEFVVDVFQAGAGTSFNMNCNEVIASLANLSLGGALGNWNPIHPNDHVNMSQSTNDTYPTATRLALLLVTPSLAAGLRQLSAELDRKARAFDSVVKSGRTHLQDAVPITLGQEFRGWARSVDRATRLLVDATDELRDLGIGGTATGTGINTPPGYRSSVVRLLRRMTGLDLRESSDMRESMQSQLPIAVVSAALRNLAVELGRIANDLRLLSSGPTTGLAEIVLPTVQPGSSIMPGKVNPSMAECLNQICFRVMGADATVSAATAAGQLELNVMMPVMASETLFAMRILSNFLPSFTTRCITGIEADRERCRDYLEGSPALATFLSPIIGYEKAAEIAKEAVRTGRSVADIVREQKILSNADMKRIFSKANLTGR